MAKKNKDIDFTEVDEARAKEKSYFEKNFGVGGFDKDSLMDAFFKPAAGVKLDTDAEGLDFIRKKKEALQDAYKGVKFYPLPVSDITSDLQQIMQRNVVPELGAKKGKFVRVKTRLGRTKKTRIT
jgi:hypothetical protein